MVNILTTGGALLSFVSLILIAVAMATNFWIVMNPRGRNASPNQSNPVIINSNLTDLTVRYDVEHLGLWVACYKEKVPLHMSVCVFSSVLL